MFEFRSFVWVICWEMGYSKSARICNAGYGGDVWNEQPAGKDHPWRYMPFHAMTPHTSGVTIDAQVRKWHNSGSEVS